MAPHSSVLAWRIPWTEEPGGSSLQGREESDMTDVTQRTTCMPHKGSSFFPLPFCFLNLSLVPSNLQKKLLARLYSSKITVMLFCILFSVEAPCAWQMTSLLHERAGKEGIRDRPVSVACCGPFSCSLYFPLFNKNDCYQVISPLFIFSLIGSRVLFYSYCYYAFILAVLSPLWASLQVRHWAQLPMVCGILVPCAGRQILNQWTTRKSRSKVLEQREMHLNFLP